jgi:hypothetical protein
VRIKLKVGLPLIFLLILLVASGIWCYELTRTKTILQNADASVEQDIRQHLSPGTNDALVDEFLKARRMLHTEVRPVEAYEREYQKGASWMLEATTADIATPISNCTVHITFRFDQNQKLLGFVEKDSCKNWW